MSTIILINLFIFLIIGSIGIFKGLDLKQWKSWLIGINGFISGFLIIFLRGDNADIPVGFQIGALFAFIYMFAGTCTYYQQRFFKSGKFIKMVDRSSLLVYGKKTRDSFNEYDVITIEKELPSKNLSVGEKGTIVFVHDVPNLPRGYEVEFIDDQGKTTKVVTMYDTEVRKYCALSWKYDPFSHRLDKSE